jgi:hypothetical protein
MSSVEPSARIVLRYLLCLFFAVSVITACGGEDPRSLSKFPLVSAPDNFSETNKNTTAAEIRAYRNEAIGLLLQEANLVAKQLALPEHLPIKEEDLTEAFVVPISLAPLKRAIGAISTDRYSYSLANENKFCYLAMLDQESYRAKCRKEFSWPLARMDTNGAYELATQFLTAVSMDVAGLNKDCELSIAPCAPPGKDHFVPLYWVYWTKGGQGHGSEAAVELFAPSRTLINLHVSAVKYNLRKSIVVTNLLHVVPSFPSPSRSSVPLSHARPASP